MENQNLDGVLPTPPKETPNANELDADKPDDTSDKILVVGSLSQTYTDILNKKFSKDRAIATESIIGYNRTDRPVMLYATDMDHLKSKGVADTYDEVTSAYNSKSFSQCVICVEHTSEPSGDYFAFEEMVYGIGMRVYRSRDLAMNALGAL